MRGFFLGIGLMVSQHGVHCKGTGYLRNREVVRFHYTLRVLGLNLLHWIA